MKLRLALSLVSILMLSSAMVSAQEREVVFLDFAWGDPSSALGERQLVDAEGTRVEAYIRVNEVSALGSLAVKSIVYIFLDDELFAIHVQVDDPKRAREVLEARYGKPLDSNSFTNDALWKIGDTAVSLKENIITKEATFILMSWSRANKYEEYRKELLKQEASSW